MAITKNLELANAIKKILVPGIWAAILWAIFRFALASFAVVATVAIDDFSKWYVEGACDLGSIKSLMAIETFKLYVAFIIMASVAAGLAGELYCQLVVKKFATTRPLFRFLRLFSPFMCLVIAISMIVKGNAMINAAAYSKDYPAMAARCPAFSWADLYSKYLTRNQ